MARAPQNIDDRRRKQRAA